MNNLKIKVITGFREDQEFTIDAEEAHKAYYLFLNPDKRGIFSNGLALIGKHIQRIEPDYNTTFGWNPSHKLTDDDWNEIRQKGVDSQIKNLLSEAKQVAYMIDEKPELLSLPLSEARNPQLT